MSVKRRRRVAPRRSRRNRRTLIITAVLAVAASAALIVAAWLRATRPVPKQMFRLPTPAATAAADAEIHPSERRALENVLEGMRPDGSADRR